MAVQWLDISKQILDNQYRWYVVSVNSGQESQVVWHLQERVGKKKMEDEIIDYLNPIINEVSYKKGEKIIKQTKLYPGYVFIKSKMNEKIWYLVRNTPWVRLIVWAEIRPIPLTDKEYDDMVAYIESKNSKAEYAVPFEQWDVVTLKDGDFWGLTWVVTWVDTKQWTVAVNIEILWRNTHVEVPFDKVQSNS